MTVISSEVCNIQECGSDTAPVLPTWHVLEHRLQHHGNFTDDHNS